ncbi:hypothetical protein OsI_29025 [Oryza sativa Indica Group]|uniref:Uncharacterized protein n=1 Tax=Oryza sativa subsp. indica TaxID=39946 RepID=B8BA96_ORYSI|nr:hypothetical protein OsI_29025 [Oryza sativa Indica Group]
MFDNGDNLISYFIKLLSKGNLVDILDPQVKMEEGGEVHEVATLAAICTKLKGDERPSMREVEMTLENIVLKKGPSRRGNTSLCRPDENGNSALQTLIEGVTTKASRQYSMELEMLSSSFPR